MNNFFYIGLFLFCVFVSACTQVALKKSADKDRRGLRIYLNAPVMISNVIFVAVSFVIVYLFAYVEYSMAVLLNAAAYVFVPILSRLYLKEKIRPRTIAGILLIITGIAVYAIFG